MIKKFLNDTVDLVVDALAQLGLLRGGAQWWRLRLERRMERMSSDADNTRRAIRATHRMCPECRALLPTSERVCSECGASMAGVPKGGAGRLLQLLVPSLGSASLTIVGVLVTLYVAMTVAAANGGFSFSLPGPLLHQLGWKWTPAIFLAGEWWRLVNPIFLHGSLMHIGFNAYALANLGPIVEQMIGARRFLVVFFATGIFSFVVSALVSPGVPSVGASGALFGLIGFGIVHGYVHPGAGYRDVAGQLVRWALFGLVMILLPMPIDHAAHFGGFAAGAALGWLVGGPTARGVLAERAWTLAAVVFCLLPLAGFALALLRSSGT
ncbi:MAG: rhomboid family intramembrane serine protease [Acidobacteriota bacterium]|nr:rhomboid family intramembrane serine protease [Acidobacteriota bacterium]